MTPSIPTTQTGFINIQQAKIYYEIAGRGQPLVMIHAGVADSRMWNDEFAAFANGYQVIRYDQRGFGKSEPAPGEFSHLDDLVSLLDHLALKQPLILMGCSMGGGLAMDFTLSHPERAKALIMVDSGPGGLVLDVPNPPQFDEIEKAFQAGDLDRVAELDTQVWFDGKDRKPDQGNQAKRKLIYEMDRLALTHEVKNLGKRLPNTRTQAFQHLAELKLPVLIVVGSQDTAYILATAEYMLKRIPNAQRVVIKDAAHFPNLDHPEEFHEIVEKFLANLPDGAEGM